MKPLRLALIVPVVGAAIAFLPLLVSADLECEIGWGKLGTQVVPEERINDGYCDCPKDGADEPHTNACSGSTIGSFTGIPAVSTESKKYQCPQQKKLQIPYSRFNDGICDCCDGSDELPSVCPDICDKVLAEERALREKMTREFSVGQQQRLKEIEDFKTLIKEKEEEKAGIDSKLEKAEELVAEAETELYQVKHEYMQQRVDRAKQMTRRIANAPEEGEPTNESLTSLLEPLPNHEIIAFIVHSCQMAGEMKDADELDETTCVPLRLAGLDSAILWSRESDGKAEMKRLHTNVRDEGKLLADLMIHNAKTDSIRDKKIMEEKEKRKPNRRKRRTRPGRRRLQEVTDDAFYDSDEDPYPDDYIPDEEDMNYPEEDAGDTVPETEKEAEPEEIDPETLLMNSLKESLFSQPRIAFLQRSKEIISGIDDLLKESDGDKEEGKEEDGASNAKDMDPQAYNMVKSTLEGRERAIERGFEYGLSATIMLNALQSSTEGQEELRADLQALAVGTLVYSNLSAGHAWQLFQSILEEFHPSVDEETSGEAKTCATSPWAASCPPRSLVIDGVSFPPQQILEAAQVLCTTPTFTKEKAQACAADADNELPTVMPDGYYGYETIHPRGEDDVFERIAAEWDPPLDEEFKTKLDELEEKKKQLEKDQRDIEDSVNYLTELIEGAKANRYGNDGELFSLKDKCFSVKAGKYTYELCVFGSAAQKEGAAKSGTGLGQWEGVEYDNETGNRILKWTKGVKCWNGPQRSATAHVTCGAETKVLSADEPDTCRYVMQMESPIACDDAFKQLHEL